MKLYCLGGLGADNRVFRKLNLDCEIILMDWIEPNVKESIVDYSLRLSKKYNISSEYGILGVSFGGLIVTEISKLINPQVTILISSVETKFELNSILRLIGKTNLIKIIPSRLLIPPNRLAHFLFDAVDKQLLDSILEDTDYKFAKWALNELLQWENTTRLENVIKIGGEKDKLISSQRVERVSIVKGGGHFMIVDKAEEISKLINTELIARHHNKRYDSKGV